MNPSDIPLFETIRAVALDVDGTIAGSDHIVSPRTEQAMERLVESGIPVILLTGRSRQNTLELAGAAHIINQVVSCNGAVIFDPVSNLDTRVQAMSDRDVATFFALREELGLEITWWTSDAIFVTHDGECRRMLIELNDTKVAIADPSFIEPGTVVKMMLFGSEARLDEVSDIIQAATPGATRSMYCFFEFVDADATKWVALKYLLDEFGIDPKTCLGIGDGGNDVIWLKNIGFPFAMGNARAEVVQATRGQIGHHDDEAAAELLESALVASLAHR
ncbi:MAG: HAD-IIB family hydrolase, partial [Pseudolysinimonas sp.]